MVAIKKNNNNRIYFFILYETRMNFISVLSSKWKKSNNTLYRAKLKLKNPRETLFTTYILA